MTSPMMIAKSFGTNSVRKEGKVPHPQNCSELEPGVTMIRFMGEVPHISEGVIDMVRQAKLGRANRMKGVCTAKKTKCR